MATSGNYWTSRVTRRGLLRTSALGAAGLSAAALIGCGSDDDEPGATGTTPAGSGGGTATATGTASGGEARQGGTLRISNGGFPPDFDVLQTSTYLTQFVGATGYNTVLKPNPENEHEIIGELAESFEVSDDGLTVTFKLHPEVTFHDGSTLTSEDVSYSLMRIKEPPEGFTSPRRGQFAGVTDIQRAVR